MIYSTLSNGSHQLSSPVRTRRPITTETVAVSLSQILSRPRPECDDDQATNSKSLNVEDYLLPPHRNEKVTSLHPYSSTESLPAHRTVSLIDHHAAHQTTTLSTREGDDYSKEMSKVSASSGTLNGLSRWCVSPGGESALQMELNRTRNQSCIECAIILQQNEFLASRVKEGEEREAYLKQFSESLMAALADLDSSNDRSKVQQTKHDSEETIPISRMNLRIAEFERTSREMIQRFDEVTAENTSLMSRLLSLNSELGEVQCRLAREAESKRQCESKLQAIQAELSNYKDKSRLAATDSEDLKRILEKHTSEAEKERLSSLERRGELERVVLQLQSEVQSLRCTRDMEVASLKGIASAVERNNENQNEIRKDMLEEMSRQLQLLRDSAKIDLRNTGELRKELQRVCAIANTVPVLKGQIEEQEKTIERLQEQLIQFDSLQLRFAQQTAKMEFLAASSAESSRKVDELKSARTKDTRKHAEAMQEVIIKLDSERDAQEKRAKDYARKSAIIVREILNKDKQLKEMRSTKGGAMPSTISSGEFPTNISCTQQPMNNSSSSTNCYRKRRTKLDDDDDRLATHQGFINFNQSQLMNDPPLSNNHSVSGDGAPTLPSPNKPSLKMWASVDVGNVSRIRSKSPLTQRQPPLQTSYSQWAAGATTASKTTSQHPFDEIGSILSEDSITATPFRRQSSAEHAKRFKQQAQLDMTGSSWGVASTPLRGDSACGQGRESEQSGGCQPTMIHHTQQPACSSSSPEKSFSNTIRTSISTIPFVSASSSQRMLSTSAYEQQQQQNGGENFPIKPISSNSQPSTSPLRRVLSSGGSTASKSKFATIAATMAATTMSARTTNVDKTMKSSQKVASNVSLHMTPRLPDKVKRTDTQHATTLVNRTITPLKKAISTAASSSSSSTMNPAAAASSIPSSLSSSQLNPLRNFKYNSFYAKSEMTNSSVSNSNNHNSSTNHNNHPSPVKTINFNEYYSHNS